MMASAPLSKAVQLIVLVVAAVFEVGGDALIRAGLRGKGWFCIALGFGVLGSYGLVLNQISIDFSKLLGGYVGLFAGVSVLFGVFLFGETVSLRTWLGLGIVLLGSVVMQWS